MPESRRVVSVSPEALSLVLQRAEPFAEDYVLRARAYAALRGTCRAFRQACNRVDPQVSAADSWALHCAPTLHANLRQAHAAACATATGSQPRWEGAASPLQAAAHRLLQEPAIAGWAVRQARQPPPRRRTAAFPAVTMAPVLLNRLQRNVDLPSHPTDGPLFASLYQEEYLDYLAAHPTYPLRGLLVALLIGQARLLPTSGTLPLAGSSPACLSAPLLAGAGQWGLLLGRLVLGKLSRYELQTLAFKAAQRPGNDEAVVFFAACLCDGGEPPPVDWQIYAGAEARRRAVLAMSPVTFIEHVGATLPQRTQAPWHPEFIDYASKADQLCRSARAPGQPRRDVADSLLRLAMWCCHNNLPHMATATLAQMVPPPDALLLQRLFLVSLQAQAAHCAAALLALRGDDAYWATELAYHRIVEELIRGTLLPVQAAPLFAVLLQAEPCPSPTVLARMFERILAADVAAPALDPLAPIDLLFRTFSCFLLETERQAICRAILQRASALAAAPLGWSSFEQRIRLDRNFYAAALTTCQPYLAAEANPHLGPMLATYKLPDGPYAHAIRYFKTRDRRRFALL